MLDYHLHLWAHGRPDTPPSVEQVAAYCERAAVAGVSEIAVTEHLFRFVQADAVLAGFWEEEPSPRLRAAMAAYWQEHAMADLDEYVEVMVAAKQAGLPVVVGLEVDHHEGRMDKVAALLEGYPFDVLLGSVHWIGGWGFDNVDDAVFAAEWEARDVDRVWSSYTRALEELAASGVCDVLAHPDLPKVTGRRPSAPDDLYDRMAEAAAASGMTVEVSSAGWRKPVGEPYPAPALLRRFHDVGVPVTTASDAHHEGDVAAGINDLRPLLADAGYASLRAYRNRVGRAVPL